MRVNYAIVFVSDMKRSVSFYRDALGLTLRFESPGWSEFATDGATLALHASEGSGRDKIDPFRVPAGHCRPGLSVPDMEISSYARQGRANCHGLISSRERARSSTHKRRF